MRSVLRRAFVVAALVGASSVTAQAQMGGLKVEEIRLDLAQINITNGTTLMAGMPGSAALGIYLNDKLALEPTIGFAYFKPENPGLGEPESTSIISFGVFAPFYFAGDRGHSGLFVSPGVMITKITDIDAGIDFGVDFGFKGKMSEKVSWRAAAQVRDGDSYGDTDIGGVFGLSVFWR